MESLSKTLSSSPTVTPSSTPTQLMPPIHPHNPSQGPQGRDSLCPALWAAQVWPGIPSHPERQEGVGESPPTRPVSWTAAALPSSAFTICVTLGNSFYLLSLSLLICKMEPPLLRALVMHT
jgi:hypothetical protein